MSTVSCEEATYHPFSWPIRLNFTLLLALSAIAAGATTRSGPEAVVSTLMSSWNAREAHEFASQFTDDATFVNVNGTIWIGSKDIEDRLGSAAAFKTTHAEIKPVSVRYLQPDVGLMHVSWTITGDPRSPRARSYLMTMIVSKRNDRWLIVASQNGSGFDHSVLAAAKNLVPDSFSPTTIGEDEDVRTLLAQLDSNWNRSDATSLSKLFAKDSDLVDISAHHFRGREEIKKHVADQLAHSLEGTCSSTSVLTSMSLGRQLAVLEVRWDLKGSLQGGTSMRITGLRVIYRRGRHCQIVAAQDTVARLLPQQNP